MTARSSACPGPSHHRPDRLPGRPGRAHRRRAEVAHLEVAHRQGRIWREGDPVWYGDVPARHEAIPVRLRTGDGEAGEVIAVVGRDTNLSTARTRASSN
ncbi:histidine kinase N-terminal domain-containing protein [Micromonospora sp. BRA006-A]|nr:histidine kinase N-terminal domain-containing protein [Micromonospora sp. BRA006-A]